MANKIIMPKLSPTMEEGQISRWLKKEGDAIEANEPIAEVDTDKATMEVTSLEAGTLLKILVGDGANARLGETIGVIGEKGEDFSAFLNGNSNGDAPQQSAVPEREEKSEPEKPAEQTKTSAQSAPPTDSSFKPADSEVSETEGRSYDYQRPDAVDDAENGESPHSKNGRLIVSPIAARMASENGVDLRSVKGSGPQGRIIKRDIETAISSGQWAVGSGHQQAITANQPEDKAKSAPNFAQTAEIQGASRFRDETTSQMRRVIAERLATSIGPVPTFYLTVEIEMDKALDFRKLINAALSEDQKVSVNDVIVKVAAQSLVKHPFVNSSYQDKTIRFYEDADIGIAVAVEEGLITPIVRGANHKGIAEISSEINEKAGRARTRKLQPEEYTGATFSISNLGMLGIESFTAIINPPEATILAIGTATPKAVVRDGEIVIRNVMNVTMSCDHRVIDGATGARFLQTFKQMLENPILMLM